MNQEWQAVYLAGLFDGEGCVAVYPRGGSYYLSCRISQNSFLSSEVLLGELALVHGGRVSTKTKNIARPVLEWQAQGVAAAAFLTFIQPYCRLKAEEIDIALDWHQRYLAGNTDASDCEHVVDLLKDTKRSARK